MTEIQDLLMNQFFADKVLTYKVCLRTNQKFDKRQFD